ncbi:hypothetical protein BD324DRAFT_575430 [Kockovaella imperatae]|uniref:RING-type domain-containing protein n=1 Tax=Kockovaella imperatae TaxID=4999 RepID=A0A1Y1UNR9_9TREE|nr:hypothetical protein BD324DRAFT_575430 [Kockovaella imperatae]ORX39690.1 hypothetical protein BD324DRAFT_575430 [Kockovaella imperatae]
MSSGQASSLPPKGMPILSGPPPIVETAECRRCNKEFNPLWRRAHSCGHCGYQYCSTCLSDGQALMPRKPGASSTSTNPFTAIKEELGFSEKKSTMSGYDVESVCLNCLSMLQVTAAPLNILRSLPLKRLKGYLEAYNIECVGPKEKEDFVQAVLKARNPTTGCLSPEAESYYRRKSVPKGNAGPSFRPPPPQSNGQSMHSTQPFQSRPPPPPPQQYRPPPPTSSRPAPATPTSTGPSPARPRAANQPAPPKPAQPPPPVPTLYSLVSLPLSYLSSLSIGTLKAILYENHVRVDFSQVLEKGELVKRVSELVTDERKRLERQAREEQLEAEGRSAEAREASPAPDGSTGEKEARQVPTGPTPDMDHDRCVVCQDEQATLAAVDCGHLAMCSHCSDLIMATSRECPLCRTRIVTPQRLIRIYRV